MLQDRVLVKGQGYTALKLAGMFECVEELKRGLNAELGPKVNFEGAANLYLPTIRTSLIPVTFISFSTAFL